MPIRETGTSSRVGQHIVYEQVAFVCIGTKISLRHAEMPVPRSNLFLCRLDYFLTYEVEPIIRLGLTDGRLRWRRIGVAAKGARLDRPALSPSRVAWITSCIADASAATRSAGAVAGRRPVDAGLTGSRRRLLRLALRLRRLNWCRAY